MERSRTALRSSRGRAGLRVIARALLRRVAASAKIDAVRLEALVLERLHIGMTKSRTSTTLPRTVLDSASSIALPASRSGKRAANIADKLIEAAQARWSPNASSPPRIAA